MKYPKWDYYSLGDAIAFGVRPSVSLDDNADKWEVYVKLVSGNKVTTARDGTRPEAEKALQRLLRRLGRSHLLITLDGCFVDMTRLVRVYIDAAPDGYVALAEDITGESHRLVAGERDECRDVVMDVVGILATLQVDDEGDDDDDEASPSPVHAGGV